MIFANTFLLTTLLMNSLPNDVVSVQSMAFKYKVSHLNL